jgi:hypothetical protein
MLRLAEYRVDTNILIFQNKNSAESLKFKFNVYRVTGKLRNHILYLISGVFGKIRKSKH